MWDAKAMTVGEKEGSKIKTRKKNGESALNLEQEKTEFTASFAPSVYRGESNFWLL